MAKFDARPIKAQTSTVEAASCAVTRELGIAALRVLAFPCH